MKFLTSFIESVDLCPILLLEKSKRAMKPTFQADI